MEQLIINSIHDTLPAVFIAGNLFDMFFGNTSEQGIKNSMLDNPILTKMEQQADDYMDFGSNYYQKAKSYFSNAFSQQAIDQSWSANRANEQNLAASGISPGGGIANQNRMQTFKDFGNKAYEATKSSLIDMWGAGQQLGTSLMGKVSDIYQSANEAYASQKSQNASNKGSALQSVVGAAAGWFLSDVRAKKDFKKIPKSRIFGYPLYEFKYKTGVLPPMFPQNFKYSGLMAQDVHQKQPEATYVHPETGYLMVDMEQVRDSYLNEKGAN